MRAFEKEITPHIDREVARRVLDTNWLQSLRIRTRSFRNSADWLPPHISHSPTSYRVAANLPHRTSISLIALQPNVHSWRYSDQTDALGNYTFKPSFAQSRSVALSHVGYSVVGYANLSLYRECAQARIIAVERLIRKCVFPYQSGSAVVAEGRRDVVHETVHLLAPPHNSIIFLRSRRHGCMAERSSACALCLSGQFRGWRPLTRNPTRKAYRETKFWLGMIHNRNRLPIRTVCEPNRAPRGSFGKVSCRCRQAHNSCYQSDL